jgi:hypothetical protein
MYLRHLRVNARARELFYIAQSIEFECLHVNLLVGCKFLVYVKVFKGRPSKPIGVSSIPVD